MDTIPVAPSRALLQPLDVPRSRARIRWNGLLAPAAAVLIAVPGYLTRWICDDALIFTRIVEQILAGNGPVYSVGERAETSTSVLWQWLLALAGFVSGNTDTSAIPRMLGLALAAGGFALAVAATRRLRPPRADRTGLLVTLPVLVLPRSRTTEVQAS
jgi:arabinofuranosyltransferase